MRRRDDTLREALLTAARELADGEGIEAVNIRAIAARTGVATGTVYNYFASKEEILLALTEEYWRQTLRELEAAAGGGSFCRWLEETYSFLRERIRQSAGRLMNSLGGVGPQGQARMASMQTALEAMLIRQLRADAGIRRDAWTNEFTQEDFARFLMMNMMMLLRTGAPEPSLLLQIVRRAIY